MPPYTYAPTVDFFIEALTRETGYEMSSFHTHRKFEIYYEVEGTRRYFIEDSAYIVNAGNVVLIGEKPAPQDRRGGGRVLQPHRLQFQR